MKKTAISICILALIYIYIFGVPNFTDDFKAEAKFCIDNGGQPIEPSPQTYNKLLCDFTYDYNATTGWGKYMTAAPDKITNKDWADFMGKKVGDYCFHCWGTKDCESPYNEVLRQKGVHC